MDEICLCDRVYVFRNGAIVAELAGAEIAEEAILAASFSGSRGVSAARTLRVLVPAVLAWPCCCSRCSGCSRGR